MRRFWQTTTPSKRCSSHRETSLISGCLRLVNYSSSSRYIPSSCIYCRWCKRFPWDLLDMGLLLNWYIGNTWKYIIYSFTRVFLEYSMNTGPAKSRFHFFNLLGDLSRKLFKSWLPSDRLKGVEPWPRSVQVHWWWTSWSNAPRTIIIVVVLVVVVVPQQNWLFNSWRPMVWGSIAAVHLNSAPWKLSNLDVDIFVGVLISLSF